MRTIHSFIISLFFGVVQSASAQNIDSMMHIANTIKDNNTKVRTLFEIADYWSYRDTAKSFHYLKQADKFIKDDYLRGIYHFYNGQNLFDYYPQQAQEAYMKADDMLKNFDKEEAYFFRTRAWHNYGAIEQFNGNETGFLKILTDICIPLARKYSDQTLLASQIADVGLILKNQKQYEKSVYYLRQASDIIFRQPQTSANGSKLIEIFGIISEIYLYEKDSVNAKNTVDTLALLIKRFPENTTGMYYYYSTGKYFQFIKAYQKALDIIEEGIEYVKKFTNKTDYSRLLNEKAFCLAKLERYEEAKQNYKESYEIAMSSNASANAVIHLGMLSEIEHTLGNHDSAYYYLKEAFNLSDSINKEQIKQTIAELETKFDTEEKERNIQELKNRTHTQKILFWSSIIVLLTIIIFFYYAAVQRKKRQQQQLQMIEKEKELEVSRALMNGEEQERMRLSRDLHDGIGGAITGIKLKLESNAQQNDSSELFKTVNQLEEVLKELRRTAKNLMPETLAKFGLEDALRDYCETMQTSNTSISFYSNNLSIITDKNKQLVIYRIIQELVNNAIKHAESTEVFLQCTLQDNLLMISIEDNGKGFDISNTKRNMGLNNIEMRVNYLEGKINIDSQPGKGTSINIECKI